MDGNEIMAIILIIGFPLLIIWFVKHMGDKSEAQKKEATAVYERFIKAQNIHISTMYECSAFWTDIPYRYIVDAQSNRVLIILQNPHFSYKFFDFNEIIGYEIFQNNRSVGGVGRGITGALLGGEIGAIIGVSTNNEEKRNVQFVIYSSNLNAPSFKIDLSYHYDGKSKVSRQRASDINSFMQNMGGSLKSIIFRNQQSELTKQQVVVRNQATSATQERFSRLKELYENGLISEDEYSRKKEELLEQL